MPELTDLDPAAAREWVTRWDRQQERYLPHREERFTAMIDAVEAAAGQPGPLVIDLGCGPGSLAVRLLARLPAATVVAVDTDPVTLSLGRAAYGDIAGLRFRDLDLRDPDWAPGLGLEPGTLADAAVSTTALHWLTAAELQRFYAALRAVLRPGGLFLDGDHFRSRKDDSPVLARLERTLEEREGERQALDEQAAAGEDWEQWWAAVAADPVLAQAAAERDRREVHHHGPEGSLLDSHLSALRAAGFTEAGTIWQHGASRILCVVR